MVSSRINVEFSQITQLCMLAMLLYLPMGINAHWMRIDVVTYFERLALLGSYDKVSYEFKKRVPAAKN